MEVSASASSVAAALRGLIFLSALCTTADETVGGGGVGWSKCVCASSLC